MGVVFNSVEPSKLATEQVDIGSKVWVFRVRTSEWVAGAVEDVSEQFNKPYEWDVRC